MNFRTENNPVNKNLNEATFSCCACAYSNIILKSNKNNGMLNFVHLPPDVRCMHYFIPSIAVPVLNLLYAHMPVTDFNNELIQK
jgi:hypothetical protein